MQPLPPRPPRTWIVHSSTKIKAGRVREGPGRPSPAALLDGGRGLGGKDVDELAVPAAVLELDHAVDLGEEGVVLAAADIRAREELRPALADEDRSARDRLAAVPLDPEVLRVRIAAVAARALSLFVRHELLSFCSLPNPVCPRRGGRCRRSGSGAGSAGALGCGDTPCASSS